jgi:hypothetical protein
LSATAILSRAAFPWADDSVGDPTAIEIIWLRAHALAVDEALDATGIEEKSSLKTGTVYLLLKVSIGVAKIFQMHAIEL